MEGTILDLKLFTLRYLKRKSIGKCLINFLIDDLLMYEI